MGYLTAAAICAAAGLLAAGATSVIHRHVPVEFRRQHHDVGSVVFLQLGVVFGVLLAFVFSEAWGEYNEAEHAIEREVAGLHGTAILAGALPPAQARAVLADERAYVDAVASFEWSALRQQRREDRSASIAFERLIGQVAALQSASPDPAAAILARLQAAHEQRADRVMQAGSGIPGVLWFVLIAFSGVLTLFVSFSGIRSRLTAALFAAVFASGITGILVSARLLDYPFEGALALSPRNFVVLLDKVDAIAARFAQ